MEQTANQIAQPVRPPAENSWDAFVDWYGRSILDWFRQSGLTQADADALVRGLMPHLAREFRQIAKEPTLRFRSWLQFAAHDAWCKLMDGRVADGASGKDSPAVTQLLSVEKHDAFLKAMDAECTSQRRREVLPRAQASVDAPDWEAFYLVALEGDSIGEAAEQMQCSEIAVRAGAFRVARWLRQELQKLEDAC
jgi:DNA-directed RNA polymerase specialized sigma24 family protein